MHGKNFKYLPADALGIKAFDNDDPLRYLNTDDERMLYDLTVVSDEKAVFTLKQSSTPHDPNFLGGIATADRSQVLWVNNTAPIPQVP